METAESAPTHEPALLDAVEMRAASGTAWQPDSTPMHAVHGMAGPFTLMGHANVFVLYDAQGSARGEAEAASVNWVMGHAGVGTGATRLQGKPLHDAQHPHDLFMELALVGRQSFADMAGVELYVAPAGEPALGPVAFPHRASAISDPLAPLTHHWLDSTHISFGVLTVGAFTHWGKVEGSWFNGREPDEERWGLDLDVPDSWSARVSVNPGTMFSGQVSYGYLTSPEALEPGVAVHRVTASVAWDRDLTGEGNVAAIVAWGRNAEQGARPTDALLGEANFSSGKHVNLFGRVEYVVKTAGDLDVKDLPEEELFPLATLALGHVFTIQPTPGLALGFGVRGNVLLVPSVLDDAYGGAVYVQARPAESERTAPEAGPHGH